MLDIMLCSVTLRYYKAWNRSNFKEAKRVKRLESSHHCRASNNFLHTGEITTDQFVEVCGPGNALGRMCVSV